MPSFGAASEKQLATCHPDLVRVARRAIEVIDFTVSEGHRNKARQDSLYPKFTKVRWPNGKHNKTPSEAFDVYVYPVNFKDEEMACVLAGVMKACAHLEGVAIRWGGDWDSDDQTVDEKFRDLGHFELA